MLFSRPDSSGLEAEATVAVALFYDSIAWRKSPDCTVERPKSGGGGGRQAGLCAVQFGRPTGQADNRAETTNSSQRENHHIMRVFRRAHFRINVVICDV
jgi:hypothetical protein